MLSGIASYLFGPTAEDDLPEDNEDVKLTTFPMENEWLLVDRAGIFCVLSLFSLPPKFCFDLHLKQWLDQIHLANKRFSQWRHYC